MLNRALNIHDAAEKPKDREWIHILLHFLRAYVEDGGRDLLLSEEDNQAYVEGLIAALKEAAQNLDNGEAEVQYHNDSLAKARPRQMYRFPIIRHWRCPSSTLMRSWPRVVMVRSSRSPCTTSYHV